MKKTVLFFAAALAFASLQAQWVDDPVNNTFIANSSSEGGEIYLSTDEVSGDTYVQWSQMRSNGWAPILQRLNFEGVPQWGEDGIPITMAGLASWSPGYAMTATSDGGVVTCFRTETAQHHAVKINADGTFPWGEEGILLFDGQGGDRSEVMAGNDGGVWVLGTDMASTFLQYIFPDRSLGPVITISDSQKNCTFGLMVPGIDNSVFVFFEKQSWAYTYYYEKEVYAVGYTTDGIQIGPEVQLMTNYTMGGSYCHYVVPDGLGGGYAYMWHAGISGAFNTYVFHVDANGFSTISDLNGTPVHTTDPNNFYLGASGTVDPISHDLLIAYEQTDAYTQSQSKVYMNRITSTGEKLWDEGILVYDNGNNPCSNITINAFEDGSGFVVIFHKSVNLGGTGATIEAIGYDMDGNVIWNTQLNSVPTWKTGAQENTGFHLGQNIIAWIDSSDGGVYGQNIGPDGTMGPIEPPVFTCLAPENFEGEYLYNMEEQDFGVQLTWTAPETLPMHYNLYREEISTKDLVIIEIDGQAVSYYDGTGTGYYKYQLTAVYENCESEPALTPEGLDYVIIEVTGIPQNDMTLQVSQNEGKINIHSSQALRNVKVYNLNGQLVSDINPNASDTSFEVSGWSKGMYILRVETENGLTRQVKTVVQ